MIDRTLDALAAGVRPVSLVFTGVAVVLVAFYWYLLTSSGGSPVDALQYWRADPNNLYPHPELLHENAGLLHENAEFLHE